MVTCTGKYKKICLFHFYTYQNLYFRSSDPTQFNSSHFWLTFKGRVGSRGVRRGERGAQFPGRQFTMRELNHCEGAELLREPPKSPNNLTSTFFNTVNLLLKELRCNHGGAKLRPWGASLATGGAKLVFCPRRHLTSLCPCLYVHTL